jgi:hypothetical protein|nr:MAG TPA: hypothetical protein [Caudoviricetes sp.]
MAWVARNRNGSLKLFLRVKPDRLDPLCNSFWVCNYENGEYESGENIDPNLLPEVTFENSPMEVKLIPITDNYGGKEND